ncbi:MAG: tRNA (adenosine(37)-N6)-threonylcarbamoyltransferase complex transferase subunit TsaD [Candidatus Geothermincolia bacterium]
MGAERGAGLDIVSMTADDLHEVTALEARVFTEPWTLEMFRMELAKRDGIYLEARCAGELYGYIGMSPVLDEGHITTLAVRPERRGQGIAKLLLTELLQRMAGSGVKWLTLEVRKSNRAAIGLYLRFGFRVEGVRRRYYRDNQEDAYIMWTPDIETPAFRQTVAAAAAETRPGTGQGVVLGIESSCDETAAALAAGGKIVGSVVASQVELHRRFGGVVPELASRAHLESLIPTVSATLEQAGRDLPDVRAVAVTHGPGLIGPLIAGISCAKALSLCLQVPLVAVNHLEAHLYSNFIEHPELEPPLVALVVSGGHTFLVHMKAHGSYELLGGTVDDAAGEAFDKVARYLGLGYPGGPAIERAAADGDPEAIRFPRAMLEAGYDMSFSGLKTAVINYVNRARAAGELNVADVAASFQAAAVDVQVHKLAKAAAERRVERVALAGGVAANLHLVRQLRERLARDGRRLYHPGLWLCTDNAAMVAYLGERMLEAGDTANLDLDAHPSLSLS